MTSRTRSNAAAVVLMISRNSGLLSISSFQRKIEVSATMLTQAANLRSTRAQAMSSASSFVPLVVRMILFISKIKSFRMAMYHSEAVLNHTSSERLFLIYDADQVRNLRMARGHGRGVYLCQRAARLAWNRALCRFPKTAEGEASHHCGARPALSGRNFCRTGAGSFVIP